MIRTGWSGLTALAVLTCTSDLSAQQSAQFLDAPVLAVPGTQQRMNALLDLNGDGWMDAVGTFWPKSDKVGAYGFLNDGAGRLLPLFASEWLQYGNNENNPAPLAVGDFDGDGFDDFAVGVRDEVKVYRSNGAANPTLVHDIYLGSGREVKDLTVADYDGDGKPDVAVRMYAVTTDADTGLRVYNKMLTVTPTSNLFLQPPAGTGFQMDDIDADGDGITDLMCCGASEVRFFGVHSGVLHGLGGAFGHTVGAGEAACGDVDGDGDDDVVVFGAGGTFQILRRLGNTSFTMDPPQVGGPATELADVDGDGDLDGVCCGGGGGPNTFFNTQLSWFEIALNNGAGGFAASFKLPSMGANHIAGVTDLDHDGDADLIAGRVVYYNTHGIEPVATKPLGGYAVTSGDADGDGDPDIHVTYQTFDANRGDGGFEARSRIHPAPPAGSTFIGPGNLGDFDGDGDQDVIVREQTASGDRQRLLVNNGGGSLLDGGPATPIGVTFGNNPAADGLLVGDVDGDGDHDVIVRLGLQVPFETRVFVRDANGLYAPSATYLDEYAAATGDIDGDGRTDLLTLGPGDARLRFGDDQGSLSSSQSLLGGLAGANTLWTPGTAVVDADADGDLDLLIGRPTSQNFAYTVRLVENIGGRQFAFHDDRFAGYVGAMLPVHAHDVNGDGAVDVLLGQRQEPGIASSLWGMSVFLGSPANAGTFAYQGEQWPLLWHMTDIDGDGDIDGLGDLYSHASNLVQSPQESQRLQYGAGTPGLGGQVPLFGAVGPFFGNAPIELRISGAAPNAAGLLFVGLGNAAAKLGGTGGFLAVLPLIVSVPVVFPSTTGEPGSGRLTLPLIVPAAATGYSFFHQVAVIDAAAQGGAALSNGLQLHYGK